MNKIILHWYLKFLYFISIIIFNCCVKLTKKDYYMECSCIRTVYYIIQINILNIYYRIITKDVYNHSYNLYIH